jgi:hypothetical protein
VDRHGLDGPVFHPAAGLVDRRRHRHSA